MEALSIDTSPLSLMTSTASPLGLQRSISTRPRANRQGHVNVWYNRRRNRMERSQHREPSSPRRAVKDKKNKIKNKKINKSSKHQKLFFSFLFWTNCMTCWDPSECLYLEGPLPRYLTIPTALENVSELNVLVWLNLMIQNSRYSFSNQLLPINIIQHKSCSIEKY